MVRSLGFLDVRTAAFDATVALSARIRGHDANRHETIGHPGTDA